MRIRDEVRRRWGGLAARRAVLGGAIAVAVAAAQVLPTVAAAANVSSTVTASAPTPSLLQQLTQMEAQIKTYTKVVAAAPLTVTGAVYATAAKLPPPQITYPTAPATFRTYLTQLTGALGSVLQAVPTAEGPQTQAALQSYGAALAGLSQSNLNQLYFYLSQSTRWQSYPAILESAVAQIKNQAPYLSQQFSAWVAANGSQYAALLGSGPGSGGSGGSTGSSGSGVTVVTPGSSTTTSTTTTTGTLAPSTSFAPTTASPTSGASEAFPPLPPDTCPPIIPYPGMIVLEHGLSLVQTGLTKGAKLAERDDTWGVIALGEGVEITIPGIIHDALTVAAFVVQAVLYAANLLDELHADCETEAHIALLRQLYSNLSRTQGQIIANTVTLIQDVTALTTIVNARTSTILQNIGYLRQQIHNQGNTILNSQSAVINVINAQTLQNLHNQQVANAARNLQLQTQLETSLATSLQQNTALFELPNSVGGYLNATPVGVQAVVSGLVAQMQQAGESIAPQALFTLQLADRALTLKKFKLAYVLYKITYQILQYVGPVGPPFGTHKFGIPVGPDTSPPFAAAAASASGS